MLTVTPRMSSRPGPVMTTFRLEPTPDSAVARYTVWQERQQIGEIRWHDLHHAVLYLWPGTAAGAAPARPEPAVDRGLWLRHDDGAEVAARGGSWLARLFAEIKFNRRWSLHGDGQVLAQARRQWHWRPGRDRLLLSPAPDATPLSAAFVRSLGGEMPITDGTARVGCLRMSGSFRIRIELQWPGLDPARAAFFMYVMHRAYVGGNGASGGGGE